MLIAGVALLLLGAAAVVVVLLDRDSDHPDEWDSRVADLIPIVEKERGLEFKHPVHVDFRSEKDFRKDMTADEGDLTQEDKDELEQTSGLLRALGLLKSDVDLFKQMIRSEEHTSELQSLMRISYAVFCLKNKTT